MITNNIIAAGIILLGAIIILVAQYRHNKILRKMRKKNEAEVERIMEKIAKVRKETEAMRKIKSDLEKIKEK